MNLDDKYISELIDIRATARIQKDFVLSDRIRDYLDTKQTFVFDSEHGQIVYHELRGMTRGKLISKINTHKRANKIFDAWLYSMQKSI